MGGPSNETVKIDFVNPDPNCLLIWRCRLRFLASLSIVVLHAGTISKYIFTQKRIKACVLNNVDQSFACPIFDSLRIHKLSSIGYQIDIIHVLIKSKRIQNSH